MGLRLLAKEAASPGSIQLFVLGIGGLNPPLSYILKPTTRHWVAVDWIAEMRKSCCMAGEIGA